MSMTTESVETKPVRGPALAWWAAATIFVSAFLLFQVQPIISKMILPWFGGSPAVWTTCVLFFQLVLLAGYAYAHALIRFVPPSRQGVVHGLLLALAIFTLPITPTEWWKPHDGSLPALRILLLLAVKVGLPYFLMSSSGPLVQAWFARAYPRTSPYRLYALSNVGSLLALLSYPLCFEPLLTTTTQGWMWSSVFLGFALLAGLLGWRVSKLLEMKTLDPEAPNREIVECEVAEGSLPAATGAQPSGSLMLGWILLPALASMLLLATTNHLCQDIAVVPVLLVVPLALYLISFILCFDSDIWYQRKFWGPLGVVSILLLCVLIKGAGWKQTALPGESKTVAEKALFPVKYVAHHVTGWINQSASPWAEEFHNNLAFQGVVYVAVLFIVCMLCHGELTKLKPRPENLTLYYLLISVGGALGGLFVALICPHIFKLSFELSMGIVFGYVVAWIALANDGRNSWLLNRQWLQWISAFVIMGGAVLVIGSTYEKVADNTVDIVRNFYGTLTVKERLGGDDNDGDGRDDRDAFSLVHGGILHGFQFTEQRGEPTTYYVYDSGAGIAVGHYPRTKDAQGKDNGIRVGVVGLGAGTMAAHAKRDDVYRFYEIDPKVIAISDKYFTFRKDAIDRGAKCEVVQGDARIQMEQEKDQNYDVIALDAFSGDAIPAHLLTVESMKLYMRHLRKDELGNIQGILAIHISNRHLNLAPVCAALARKYELTPINISVEGSDIDSDAFTGSDWVLLTQNTEFLTQDIVLAVSRSLAVEQQDEVLWTDQHSSLLPILKSDWVVKMRKWWKK
ncbi:fused MFS/spermidine synthase [Anatilimnocola floriformis]|uniref:fused MFS/spermidine synthase n=1 Tax=Anatilimnocola floriformis TaxID=2948575 RepID=UPI0020C34994|nr:fused MFS/spermidine synthase [Anatilimnocola floriformis]